MDAAYTQTVENGVVRCRSLILVFSDFGFYTHDMMRNANGIDAIDIYAMYSKVIGELFQTLDAFDV